MKNNWLLEEKKFETTTALAYEGLFTLGSGYLHTRASFEEGFSGEQQNITAPRPAFANASAVRQGGVQKTKWGTYVPGIFAHHPNLNEEMVNLPYFLEVELSVAGEKLDLSKSSYSDFERILDMKTASLKHSLVWHTAEGDLDVQFERFISGNRPQLSMQRATFRAMNKAISLSVKTGIDADVRTNGYDHFVSTQIEQKQNRVKSVVCTNENPFFNIDGTISNVNGGDAITTLAEIRSKELDWQFEAEERRGFFSSHLTVPAGESLVIEKRTAVSTSHDLADYDLAEDVLKKASVLTFDQIFEEHKYYWAGRWEKSDLVIESGDEQDDSQLAMRASIFHLLRCHVPGDSRVAIDAKGAAGEIYYGRYFWDTEIYMLPFFLYTDPDRAKTLTDFRVETLSEAKRNAARGGYTGARYSWESDSQGNDCCPPGNWQYRDHEIHISADVAYAFAHFAANTNEEYLKNPKVAGTLVEIARFWVGRVDWKDNLPHLLGVMGPDEYTPLTSDNAYTNYMVAFTLKLAVKYGKFGAATEDEIAEFTEIAEKLPILRDSDNIILQCKEFDDLADPQFDKLWPGYTERMPRGHYAEHVTQERLYRSKCLKQADVLMLAFLFPKLFTKEELQKTWDKYVPYTTHDSSLSLGVHALLANRMGQEDLAWQMLQKCMFTDLDVKGESASEGIHIAGCGMNWQMLVFGIVGLSNALQSDVLTIEPHLPPQWEKVAFPFIFRGQSLYISLEKNKIIIENKSNQELEVIVSGRRSTIMARRSSIFE